MDGFVYKKIKLINDLQEQIYQPLFKQYPHLEAILLVHEPKPKQTLSPAHIVRSVSNQEKEPPKKKKAPSRQASFKARLYLNNVSKTIDTSENKPKELKSYKSTGSGRVESTRWASAFERCERHPD